MTARRRPGLWRKAFSRRSQAGTRESFDQGETMVSHQHLADVHVRRNHDSTSRSLGCLDCRRRPFAREEGEAVGGRRQHPPPPVPLSWIDARERRNLRDPRERLSGGGRECLLEKLPADVNPERPSAYSTNYRRRRTTQNGKAAPA